MRHRLAVVLILCTLVFGTTLPLFAQSPTATVNGQVRDTTGAVVQGADVQLINDHTNVKYPAKTNSEGIYSVTSVPPGTYRIQVSKVGFKTIIKPDIVLNVLDARAINFDLPVGAVSETITVEAGTSLVNTESAAVSTVVDRQFAENLPMNGRSLQTLIQLTPGVVLTSSNYSDNGQFSVNGQRASSNYWMVDGVSANIGVGVSTVLNSAGNGLSGALGSFSSQGGTNSLVSVDALQEFRIQTSTFAPEFGRTPGGQISIVTRSGTNQFHGTAFDYFRNDVFDSSNWFNGYTNNPPLPKSEERQNDFGGTLSGPIVKDRTFFFFSYEGLRLRLPKTTLTTVPDLSARQNALPDLQPYLNAFPFDPDQSNLGNGIAQFNASFSNSSTLDAYSLRIDHRLTSKFTLFGRYNYSPSETIERPDGFALSVVSPSRITTQTATGGLTWGISPTQVNDLRFNYSRTNSSRSFHLDNFGGAVPLTSLPFPSPYTSQDSLFEFGIFSLANGFIDQGISGQNGQRQINVVDNLSIQEGSHSIKVGVDFRRLSPQATPQSYYQGPRFLDVPSAENGKLLFSFLTSGRNTTFLFRSLGLFAQDTWRILPRLTLTYGLRWDIDFVPSSIDGPNLPAAAGFKLTDLSQLALAPEGTPPFSTTYGNVAPRLGLAYEASQKPGWGRVLRGGFGVFYDLADGEVGNILNQEAYPFGATSFICCFINNGFPLSPEAAAPPSIVPPGPTSGTLTAFDPNLKLPYTLEWNAAFEQALGSQQTLSLSYIGSVGRRLIQSGQVTQPNPNLAVAYLVSNAATSNYNALQLQFQRRLSRGFQALASYTWSHSIDTASAGSLYGNAANALVPAVDPNINRGPSDFDIRDAFSAGLTYEIPAPKINVFADAILGGWSLQSIIQARSASPVNIFNSFFGFGTLTKAAAEVRPDVVPGIPLYSYGPQYPGGKAFNDTPGAVVGGCADGSQSVGPFCPPPTDANGSPLRQGNLGRNALKGFGATQWDFAVHRDFRIKESLKLQFRAEMFNLLNHPNFAPPVGDLSGFQGKFGRSTRTLGEALGQNVGGGGFSALYQIGGPRSMQFALKLIF